MKYQSSANKKVIFSVAKIFCVVVFTGLLASGFALTIFNSSEVKASVAVDLVTQINTYALDGTLMNQLDFTYNENLQLSSVQTSTDSEGDKIWKYNYDDAGRLLQVEFILFEESFVIEEYHYNPSGQLISSYYSDDGGTETEYRYIYDDQGTMKKRVGKSENYTIVSNFEYDLSGLAEKRYDTVIYNQSGEKSFSTTKYEYDDMGRKISEVTNVGNAAYQSSYRYDLLPVCINTDANGVHSLWISDGEEQMHWNMGIGTGDLIIDAEGRLGKIQSDYCYYEFCYGNFSMETFASEEKSSESYENTVAENGLVIYSDHTNLSIRKGSTITLGVGIVNDGELINDLSGITFQIENMSILKNVDIEVKDKRQYVKLKGLVAGTTRVGFVDSNTGDTLEIPITVYEDNYLAFTLNSVPPAQYIDKYPSNIYNVNGLYIDNYNWVVNDDQTASVSFDVYNTNYSYGVVEVYKEDGTLEEAVLIDKKSSSNTSIKEALWDNSAYLLRDAQNKNFGSYRQESGVSKHTSVRVVIPKNGYIKICNDPENSFIVGMVNSACILMSLKEIKGDVDDFNVNSKVFSEKITQKLVKDKMYELYVKDGSEFPKNLMKNISKELMFSTEALGNFSDTLANNLSNLDVIKIIAETGWELGWSIGEGTFEDFSGPIGMALKGMFSLGKVENMILQQNTMQRSCGIGSIYIQNQGGGIRSSQQITVESDTDFSSETSLNVYQVTLDSSLLEKIKDINPEVYKKIQNGIARTYNISLLNNGKETQPDSKVKVYIPIPEDMKLFAYAKMAKIYRVEENGELTEMDVKIEDGCFTFETSHFSLYTLVGDTVLAISLDMVVLGIVICSSVIIVIIRRKNRNRQKL